MSCLCLLRCNKDWLHESCLHLRERPPPRQPTPDPEPQPDAPAPIPPTSIPQQNTNDDDDDDDDASSTSSLPPPLLTASDYDTLICGACVLKSPILLRWAGTPGVLMVIKDDEGAGWKVLGKETGGDVSVDDGPNPKLEYVVGEKRPLSPSSYGLESATSETKKPRTSPLATSGLPGSVSSPSSSSRCLAPPSNPTAQNILTALRSKEDASPSSKSALETTATATVASADEEGNLCAGDIFLTQDWRGRWCRCDEVGPFAKCRCPFSDLLFTDCLCTPTAPSHPHSTHTHTYKPHSLSTTPVLSPPPPTSLPPHPRTNLRTTGRPGFRSVARGVGCKGVDEGAEREGVGWD